MLLIKKTQGLNKDKDNMARISGVDIPKSKRGEVALTYIYGVGRSRASKILNEAKVDLNKKVSDWTDSEIKSIIQSISKYKVEGELRSEVAINIKRLKDIGSYKGLRHRRGLPANGQRTKTNARTRKGKKRTIGLGKN